MAARDIIIESIKVTDIFVTGNRRPVSEEAVQSLAVSIRSIGIQHPITVRFVDHLVDPVEGELDGAYVLVAGRHRLEAARSLSMDCIDCVVVRWDERQARKWEIAENLHRSDLTELQRKEQIAEWIALAEAEGAVVSAQVAPKPQGGRPEGGINAASRELGVERTEAQRAVKVASISERAKQAAVEARLDNNQSALLRIASVTPEDQVEKVRQIAAERAQRQGSRKPTPPSDAPRNDFEVINSDHRALVRAWEAARPEARDLFLSDIGAVIDTPVMDRRHA